MNSLDLAKGGKIEIKSRINLTRENLSLIYTPGVADVVTEIMKDSSKVYDYTGKSKSVAIVTDGSAILGLGNQGPEAALPVMEAKAVLFKKLGGVNAVPITLKTQNPDEIVEIVKQIAPTFGGINLEDIAAPACFIVKEKLKKELNIPVFHDDQYGTAIVVLAGLINALKVVNKKIEDCKIIVSGAGAAGIASAKLMRKYGAKNIIVFDSKGAISNKRKDLNFAKKRIAQTTNPTSFSGDIQKALLDADIFVGLSKANILNRYNIEKMNTDAIVFALANPSPEIMPEEAKKGGAKIIATGRSDFPNQINNALVFPGIFKGALKTKTVLITDEIKLNAAIALASTIKHPDVEKIMPHVMDEEAVNAISNIF